MIRKWLLSLFCLCLGVFSGCETTADLGLLPGIWTPGTNTTPVDSGLASTPAPSSTLPRYNGPKVKVAVMSFEDETGDTRVWRNTPSGSIMESPLGSGMAEQMVTALMQAGYFSVIDSSFLDSNRGAGANPPDYLIKGSITEFTVSQQSASGGLGLGGGLLSGGSSGWAVIVDRLAATASASSDRVAIDVSITNPRTGEYIYSNSFIGTASDLDGAIAGALGQALIGFSTSYKTPISKSIRACIIKAINDFGPLLLEEQNIQISSN